MIQAYFQGLLVGLPFVLVIGPALFAILQTSMNKGFYSGMQLAMGISMSDMLLMFLCYFGVSEHMKSEAFQVGLGLTGSVILLVYGIVMARKKTISTRVQKEFKINWFGVFSEIGKGFFLNIMNPFLWMLWLTIVSTGTANKERFPAILFMLGIVSMIFTTDLLKSFFANKIMKLLSPSVIYRVNKVIAVVLIVCSVVLLVRTFYTYSAFLFPCK